MKIPIYDSESGWLGAIPIKIIKIKDASSGLQKVTVRVPSLKVFDVIRPRQSVPPRRQQATAETPSPEKPAGASPAPGTAVPRPAPATSKHIEITLTIPRLPKLSDIPRGLGRLLWKNRRITGVVCVALVAATASYILLHRAAPATPMNSATAGPPQLVKGTPDYTTVLPSGKTIADYGGWTRISPPGRDPVYAYVDTIGNVQVSVSEQPLPAGFAADPTAQIAKLAQNFNATNKFTVGGAQVYVSTSSDGEQSVILGKGKLLLLLKSNSLLTNTQWATYISTLR